MKLIVEENGRAVTYDLHEEAVTLGRGLENTIPIRDKTASRKHLRLTMAREGASAEDLGSRNGTLLNGRKLGTASLSPGDCLQIGDARIWVERRAVAEAASAPSPRAGHDDETSERRVFTPQAAAGGEAPSAGVPSAGGAAPSAGEAASSAGGAPSSVPPPAAPGGMARSKSGRRTRYRLEVLSGPSKGTAIPVPAFPFKIGRRRLNHLVIRDGEASGTHAELIARPGGAAIRDLGSTNGTYVDEVRIERAPLRHNARIRIGDSVLRFCDLEEETRAAGVRTEPSRPTADLARAAAAAPAAAAADSGEGAPRDASGLWRAVDDFGRGAEARADGPGAGRGIWWAGALVALVLLTGAALWFRGRAAGSGAPEEVDPAPVANAVAHWSFEERDEGDRPLGWAVRALGSASDQAVAGGHARSVRASDAPGGRRVLSLEPGAGAMVVAAAEPVPVAGSRVDVRAYVHAEGRAGLGVLWEVAGVPGATQLVSTPLGAKLGWTEVRGSFTPPPGYDLARIVLLARDPARFDRVAVDVRDVRFGRVRRVAAGGLEAVIRDDGVVRLALDGRPVVHEMWVGAPAAAATLRSQRTPLSREPVAPLAAEKGDADRAGAGWRARGEFGGRAEQEIAAYELATRETAGGVSIAVAAPSAGDGDAVDLVLHVAGAVAKGLVIGSAGADTLPLSADEVTEIALGSGRELFSLGLAPPCAVHASRSAAGLVLRIRVPASGRLVLTARRGSDRRAREAAARSADESAIRRRSADAARAIDEAKALADDLRITRLEGLVGLAERRLQPVLAGESGPSAALAARALLGRLADRRDRLRSRRRRSRAARLYATGREHLQKGRLRLARAYFSCLIERFGDVQDVRDDAARDRAYCEKRLGTGS